MFKALENLLPSDKMKTSHDEVEKPHDDLFEAHCEIHEDHPHMETCDDLASTVDDLEHLHDVIHTHGVSKSMMAFANKDGVLSSAMPAFSAMEALDDDAPADSPEAEKAKESVMDKIKEVSAIWFKKAWEIATGWGMKIDAFAKAAYDRVNLAAKWFAGKTFDVAKATEEHIKAHPVAWVVGSATAAATMSAVILGLWTEKLPTDADGFKAWSEHLKTTVEKVVRDSMDKIGEMAESAGDMVKSGTAISLGYTKDGFDSVVSAMKGLYSEGGALTKLADFFKSGVHHVFEALKIQTGDAWKYTRKALVELMHETYHLFSRAPSTTLKYFSKAMRVFKSLFTTTSTVEA